MYLSGLFYSYGQYYALGLTASHLNCKSIYFHIYLSIHSIQKIPFGSILCTENLIRMKNALKMFFI